MGSEMCIRDSDVVVEGRPVTLPIDAEKIASAVGNLLSNAIRFSPRGGRILIQLIRFEDLIRIDVADEGPGVHENDRARIFEPFYRGVRQPEDAARGTGIGLSIVQEYVAAHGGRVSLVEAGERTPFRIELPHAS